ncbi:MAG: GTPase Era [Caldilineaceae bacterium]|nr:GTPase Era [Caldilineaceae bacterium]
MLPIPEQLPDDHRSGFITVIGRPNVGKSTLLNRLLGQKIAITSPKPQTTRDQIMGIFTTEEMQIVFLDTPGVHAPTTKLGEHMMSVVNLSVDDADVILWLVDVHVPPKDEDRAIAELLREAARRGTLPPVIIGLNKLDRPENFAVLPARRQEYAALLDWLPAPRDAVAPPVETVAFSALNGENVDTLLALLQQRLPLGPRYYPADQVTDLQVRFIVAELIREKALLHLQQEVPHSLAVVVDEFSPRDDDMTYISAVIYVERSSHKSIVLGRGGSMIKRIGQSARPEIETLVGTKVYLELWVKVWEKWRRKEAMLRRLGYATE